MYVYIKAVLREGAPNSQYREVDIRQLRLDEILKRFNDGYIHLVHSNVTSPFYVPINDLRGMELPYGLNKFEIWLGQVAAIALPTYDEEPIYQTKYVYYSDALQAGFQPTRVFPTTLDFGPEYPPSLLTDLLMTKDGYNADDLLGKCLFTVNGMLHNVGYGRSGVVVYGGARTIDVSKRNTVGVLSFEEVGTVETVYLDEGKILGGQLRSEIFLKLGKSLRGKSLALSIGGYLHVCDASHAIIDQDNGIVRINTPLLDIQRRMMRCLTRIDLSSLGLTAFDLSDNAIIRSEALNNIILRKYLTLPQSFAIIIDTPHLYAKRNLLAKLPISGYTESATEPLFPLVDSYGHLLEYWRCGNGNQWARISDNEAYYNHELYHTGDTAKQTFITDANDLLGYDYHQYCTLEIGSQKYVNQT